MFDAYTVKKVLPRLVIAAILIQLSWELFTLLMEIVNNIAWGVEGLLYAPFGGRDALAFKNVIQVPGTSGGGLFITASLVAVTAGGISLGIIGILSLALSALVGIAIGFFALAVRQVVLYALLVTAPLGLVAWILPNTEKFWKLWWESFSKLLMMYPLILLLIAAGRITAVIAGQVQFDASGNLPPGWYNSGVTLIIVTIGYFGPFFLIPKTFEVAGRAFGIVTGAVNNRSKGALDRLSKGRAARREDRVKRAGVNSLWDKNSAIGRRANTAAGWLVSPGGNLAYSLKDKKNMPFSKTGRRIAGQIEHAQVEQTKKLFEEMNNAGANDKTYRVLGGMHRELSANTQKKLSDRGLLGKSLKSEADILTAAQIMSESSSETEQIAAGALHAMAPRLSSLHLDGDMNRASIAGASAIGLGVHGFLSGQDAADSGNILIGEGGLGMAQAVVSQAQLAGARSRPDVKNGYGTVIENGKFVNGTGVDAVTGTGGSRAEGVLKTIGQGDIVGAKGGFLDAMGGTIKDVIRRGNTTEGKDALSVVAKMRAQGMNEASIAQMANSKGQNLVKLAGDYTFASALKDELVTAASAYSSSPVDTKAKSQAMIAELGFSADLQGYNAAIAAQQGLMGGGGPSGGTGIAPPPPGQSPPGQG